MTLQQADSLGNALVTDPAYKAGQDPAGGIGDALMVRTTVGPSLDYYGTPDAPIDMAGSEEAIYGDTIDVTDADWLHVEVMFHLQSSGGAETENANLAVGLESSQDGVYWSPYTVVNRASLISPSTMFRNDTGQTAGAPSATGGYAAAATTQNAPLLEDLTPILPAVLTTTGNPIVVQRAIPFNVASALYVRVVLVPIYTEPPDRSVPALCVRVNKAAS